MRLTGQRIWGPSQPIIFGNLVQTVASTAYALHIEHPGNPGDAFNYVILQTDAANLASGSQAAEVAIATTPLAPNGAGQTLTVVAAQSLAAITAATAMVRNTSSLAYTKLANLEYWMVVRINMGTTQPKVEGIARDYAAGVLLTTASAAVLAVNNTLTGLVPAVSGAIGVYPYMRVTSD